MSDSSFMGTSPFLLLFLLGYCLAVIEGELRCYCNESSCVATGYMCKSSAGQCFTAVEVRGEVTHQTHGCLDSLPEEHRASCRVGVDVVSASNSGKGTRHLPLLLCCTEHMCNYREDIDVSIILTPKYNGTFQRGSGPASEDNAIYSHNHPSNPDDDRDLWFKAAVIAVPIAGGFILVLLVLLAVRMLKTDSRYHRRLIQIRREHSLTKAHMYISDHFGGKTSKQHCSLFNEKTKVCAPIYSENLASHTNSSSGNSNNSSNARHSSHHSDTSNKRCSYTSHNEHDTNRCTSNCSCCGSTLLPCNSNLGDTTATTTTFPCSTKGDNHSNSSGKPCSFHSDLSSKNVCLSRDVSVKLDRAHMFPHVTRMDSSSDYHHPSVAMWDKACAQGPTAAV